MDYLLLSGDLLPELGGLLPDSLHPQPTMLAPNEWPRKSIGDVVEIFNKSAEEGDGER